MKAPQRPASLRGLGLVMVAACAVAFGLGLWQLQRRAAKQALVAEISARAKAAPEVLPAPAEWSRLAPRDYEYRHVVLEGRFDHDKQVLVFRAAGGGTTGIKEPGYDVLTPLQLASGAIVVVNRGFVPRALGDGVALHGRAQEAVTRITGLMRAPEPRNLFTPPDDLARGRAFTRDPLAIAAHFGLAGAAPFSIDADAAADPRAWPKGGTTELRIPDNHLSYALTWFGLAATGVAVFCSFAWSQRHVPA